MNTDKKSQKLRFPLINSCGANAWPVRLSLAAALLAVSAFDARSAVIDWSGLSGVTNGWSDFNNWSSTQVPGSGDSVIFTNAGAVGTVGAVNNTVAASTAVSNLTYAPISPGGTTIEADTTAIPAGVTLRVGSGPITTDTTVLYVGADGVNTADVVYANITGPGTLAVGNVASPNINTDIAVRTRVLTANSGTHTAILDMSGLNMFTFGGGRFHVGSDAVSYLTYPTVTNGFTTTAATGYTNCDRANGVVYLAKTNVIIAAYPTVATSHNINFPYYAAAFAIGADPYANGGGLPGQQCLLGQQNTIYADGMIVGGARTTGAMSFQTAYAGLNPTLKLRGANGISRVAQLAIGDNDQDHATTASGNGTLDLSLGTVDALVDVMIVGRCSSINTTSGTGGNGTVTLAAGTCDVGTLNIGCQRAAVLQSSTGTVNVLGAASLISTAINIGNDISGPAFTVGTGNGTLNINGGSVSVLGDILEADIAGQRGNSTINIQNGGILNMEPPGDTVPGNILSLGTLSWDVGTLTNYGILGVSFINQPNAVDFIVYPGQTLAPLAPGLIGKLAVQAGLVLNSATLSFDLNNPSSTNDQIIVTNTLTLNGVSTIDVNPINGTIASGTYTLMTYGSLSGNAANLHLSTALANSRYTAAIDTSVVPNINLNISGSASSLIWSGDGTANVWNLNGTANWTGGSQTFYDLDNVTFDDSGSETPPVNLVGTLSPASVTVNTGNSYTFAGTGKISGDTGLTNIAGGTLTILNTNDYTGPTAINAGTVLVIGKLGNTAVSVTNGATLGGTGTILGTVTVNTFSILSPGNVIGGSSTIGTLTISNTLILSNNSLSLFDVDVDALTSDQVVGLNKVAYGGILELNLTGRALAFGDSFKLFDAHVYSGSFSSIIPSSPGSGLYWNTNLLKTSGTLGVTAPIPVITSVAPAGPGNILISGTGGYPGGNYTVVASAGLSAPLSSWTPVGSGSFDNNGLFSITVATTGNQQFFALQTTP